MSSTRKQKQQGNIRNFNLVEITPLTEGQKDLIESYKEEYNLVLHGFAGTGKTFLSIGLAISDILKGKYKKLIILRSVVPTRDIGFLPGSISEKIGVYEAPYYNIFNELFNRGDAYEIMKKDGIVEFSTTSFLRGTTFNDCIIVVDEFQNAIFEELHTIITRVGKNCKIIFCGDITQNDLTQNREKSGLPAFMKILGQLEEFDIIDFTADDIVRSDIVKSYILKKQELIDNKEIAL